MDQALISIRPMTPGWRLDAPQTDGPQVFLSGARAEAAAHALAQRLAESAGGACVVIYDRSESVIGETTYAIAR